MASGTLKATLEGHTGWVTSVAVTLDGAMIVSGSVEEGTMRCDTTCATLALNIHVRMCVVEADPCHAHAANHGSNLPCLCLCSYRTWDIATATETGVFEASSDEAQKLLASASKPPDALQQDLKVVGNTVVHWEDSGSTGQAYVMPPCSVQGDVICSQACRTIAFFSDARKFMCYRLQ